MILVVPLQNTRKILQLEDRRGQLAQYKLQQIARKDISRQLRFREGQVSEVIELGRLVVED